MDGSTSTTGGLPQRDHAPVGVDGGCPEPAGALVSGDSRMTAGRIHLVAPARWKAGLQAGPVGPKVLLPAPAQWAKSRRRAVSGNAAARPEPWWHRCLVAVRGLACRMQAAMSRMVACLPSPEQLQLPAVAGIRNRWPDAAAMCGVGVLALAWCLSPSPLAPVDDAWSRVPLAEAEPPVMSLHLPAMMVPRAVKPVAAITVQTVTAGHDEAPEKALGLWADITPMDLNMPIAEPDLDISSGDSLWHEIGDEAGIDPLLLYSIALVESKALHPDGRIAPTPWLFRVDDRVVRGSRSEVQLAMAAASQFGSAVKDVGIMQVYYPVHRNTVRDPLELLDPRTNITVAAKILRDAMRRTSDPVLGVGYYHSRTPSRARNYGNTVLAVYQRMKALHRPDQRHAAAGDRRHGWQADS